MNKRTAARQETEATIVRTALSLMAVQGVDAVSMNEVVKAAGQRNASAINYYFGDKVGLVQAIFDKYRPGIDQRRQEMLEAFGEDLSLEQMAQAMVLPLIAELDNPDGGREYLQMLARLDRHELNPVEGDDSRRYPTLIELGQLMLKQLDHLEPEDYHLRFRAIRNLILHTLADYTSIIGKSPEYDGINRPLFTNILVQSIVAILSLDSSPIDDHSRPAK